MRRLRRGRRHFAGAAPIVGAVTILRRAAGEVVLTGRGRRACADWPAAAAMAGRRPALRCWACCERRSAAGGIGRRWRRRQLLDSRAAGAEQAAVAAVAVGAVLGHFDVAAASTARSRWAGGELAGAAGRDFVRIHRFAELGRHEDQQFDVVARVLTRGGTARRPRAGRPATECRG